MKHLLAACLWAVTTVALAQTPAMEPPGAGDEPAGQSQPCVNVGSGTQADQAQSGPVNSGTGAERSAAEPCPEPLDTATPEQGTQDEAAAVEALAEGPQASVEEDADIRASADEVFEPDDEIPEDYPVPLPSDI